MNNNRNNPICTSLEFEVACTRTILPFMYLLSAVSIWFSEHLTLESLEVDYISLGCFALNLFTHTEIQGPQNVKVHNDCFNAREDCSTSRKQTTVSTKNFKRAEISSHKQILSLAIKNYSPGLAIKYHELALNNRTHWYELVLLVKGIIVQRDRK